MIQKYDPANIKKLRPLHGEYYNQMVERQKNSFSIFMEKILELSVETNCYDIDKLFKIFKIVSNTPLTKNSFGKRMCEWLLQNSMKEFEIKVKDVYPTINSGKTDRIRRQVACVKDSTKLGRPTEDTEKLVFDIFEFIEETDERGIGICDDKNKELGDKPHPNNIKQELF